jgi:triphosphatase
MRRRLLNVAELCSRKAVKPYLRRCKDLQKLLGQINDSATVVRLAQRLSGRDRLDLAPALAVVARWSADRRCKALREVPAAWDRFGNGATFWQ